MSKSRTVKELRKDPIESIISGPERYRTTITRDDGTEVSAVGATSEEAEKNVSEKNKEESKDSGCFLTTACIEAAGLPDDCIEL